VFIVIERVAYLSMHTSPLLQPGQGDAGGMNVYVDELASTMAGRGIEVHVYTRRDHPDQEETVVAGDGMYLVHHVEAGPVERLSVSRQARFVREFGDGVLARFEQDGVPDIVHSHYWLSGWAGLSIKRLLGIPLANSFHTLGRVKDLSKREDEGPESLLRIAAEFEVIEESDCVVASTPLEAEDLMDHYGADPTRLCTSPPGVDHTVFNPGSKEEARTLLGIDPGPVALFVGRIQPLKAADVAIAAMAVVVCRVPSARLLVVGGPSGPAGEAELARLKKQAADLGLEGVVEFLDPVPHPRLAHLYRAADVLVLPSRSETFGLVAAEAQACGLPVVAANVGGIPHVVSDGESGLLVDDWDPAAHADAIIRVMCDPVLADALSAGAIKWAERFSWEATANRFLELYEGALAGVAAQ
jgi:D-inositol-3-phosphate glycosyltransferase